MSQYWLDNNVIPVNYKLSLDVFEEKYVGKLVISCEAKEETSAFFLDAKELKILECNFSHTVENNRIKITNSETFSGNFEVEISFEKEFVMGHLDGFYKSKWNDTNLFTTKFEPNCARKAYPCFDQPDLKATYDISITCDKKYVALSNDKVISSSTKNDRTTFVFDKTPKMSTYIVAWAIGELEHISATTKSNVTVNVYAIREELSWGEFSLNTAVKCVEYFEEYFAIPYPLSKMDLLGFPAFAGGAMENWGLIMFRKMCLLHSESSFAISKINIANTVCHEIAHMWFGNLVTMKWWNDLWLNEGFATWAASKVLADTNMFPGINMWEHFDSGSMALGMKYDSLSTNHPVASDVKDPDEIGNVFDAISYHKGASVIRMIENWVGPENFRAALREYMEKHKYKNTVTQDLWDSINQHYKHSDGDVAAFVDNWINIAGYPVISVSEKDGVLHLTQKAFDGSDSLWYIPLSITWGEDETEQLSFRERTISIPVKNPLYRINSDAFGFYRVQYSDVSCYKRLLSSEKINSLDKLYALENYNALMNSKRLPLDLSVFSTGNECDYLLFQLILSSLANIQSIFYDDENKKKEINDIVTKLLSEPLKKILAEPNPLMNVSNDLGETLTNACVFSYSAIFGLLEPEKINTKLHQEFVKGKMIAGADVDFEHLKSLYGEIKTPGLREYTLTALGFLKKKETFEKLMKDLSFIEVQDIYFLFVSLSGSIHFRNEVVCWFIDNFEFVKDDLLKRKGSLLRMIINGVFSNVLDSETEKKAIGFEKVISGHKDLYEAYRKGMEQMKEKKELRN